MKSRLHHCFPEKPAQRRTLCLSNGIIIADAPLTFVLINIYLHSAAMGITCIPTEIRCTIALAPQARRVCWKGWYYVFTVGYSSGLADSVVAAETLGVLNASRHMQTNA